MVAGEGVWWVRKEMCGGLFEVCVGGGCGSVWKEVFGGRRVCEVWGVFPILWGRGGGVFGEEVGVFDGGGEKGGGGVWWTKRGVWEWRVYGGGID